MKYCCLHVFPSPCNASSSFHRRLARDHDREPAASFSSRRLRESQAMNELSPGDVRYDNIGYFSWAAAQRRPRATALIDLSRAEPVELSYCKLEERLNRFASLTARLGLKPGDRLAMSVGNRYEFVEIMYGAMRAGVVPVPLNTRLGADTLDYIIRNAGCVAAVVEPAA